MKSKSLISTIAGPFLASALLLGVSSTAQANTLEDVLSRGTIRIAVIGGNPPYSTISPSGEPEGYDIDIGKNIAAALNVKPEFIVTDVPGRVTSLQTKKADITIADFTNNVQRATVIAFTHSYIVAKQQFVTKADNAAVNSIADVNKAEIHVGITRGGTVEQNVPLAAPAAQIMRFNTVSDQLSALDSGQVEVMAQDNLYNAQLLKDHPGAYKIIPGDFSHEDIAIGLPAGEFDWLRVLDTFVDHFNASGDNARLFKKWFGYDMPPL
jgi:polar amino acid transport system substrate-binding protein